LRVSDLSDTELCAALQGEGLGIRTGPFSLRIRSDIPDIADNIALLYADQPLEQPDEFVDFNVRVAPPRSLRRWWRPQVLFQYDDWVPFKPLPADQAVPMLEWGLNWCVSSHAHQYLILHAAVLERHGRALIFPAPPGSGKSTLCAALACHGWRLLSDELGLIDMQAGHCHGLARPVNLKNRSIEVLQERLPQAVFSRPFHDTAKGTVALMRPPADSVRRVAEPAIPGWIVSVRYEAGARTQFRACGKGRMFMQVADTAFNYVLLAQRGFRALSGLIRASDCYELVYSDLDEVLALFDRLEPPATREVAG
jgi:HprK-related kinase A